MAEFVTNLLGRRVQVGQYQGTVVGAVWGTLLVEWANGTLGSVPMNQSVRLLPESGAAVAPVADPSPAPAAAPAVSPTGTGPGTRFVGG